MRDIYFREQPRSRSDFRNDQMDTNGSMSSGLVEIRKKTEFCRRCKQYGHLEIECRGDYGGNRTRGRSRSPMLSREPGTERCYERGRRSEQYDQSDVRSGPSLYTPDEIAQKIAQQREELVRREMMMRSPEAIDAPHSRIPSTLYPPQPLFPHGGNPGALAQSMNPLVDPILIENQLRAAREEEEFRSKKEAEARKMEEEQRLKEKERELERRMQMELEEKKRAMEEEIRRQVQMEERAKLQIELAQRHTQQNCADQSFPQFPSQHPNSASFMYPSPLDAFGTGDYACELTPASYSSAPDFEMEEIKRLVKETEEKLLDLQRNAREAELSAIFQSRAFRTVAELGDNAYTLDRKQKQHLLRELKDLLSHAGPRERERKTSDRHRSRSKERSRKETSRHHREHSSPRRSRSPRHHGSYRHSREREVFKEVRHQVGGITLRNLSPAEQRRLKAGDIVVAQDAKSGKWTTAHITKISNDRATLTIGNTTWRKDLDELFKEVPEWSRD